MVADWIVAGTVCEKNSANGQVRRFVPKFKTE
jgi:hypothetical protein